MRRVGSSILSSRFLPSVWEIELPARSVENVFFLRLRDEAYSTTESRCDLHDEEVGVITAQVVKNHRHDPRILVLQVAAVVCRASVSENKQIY